MTPHSIQRQKIFLAASAIVLAAAAAYHNTFSVPFLFDDQATIQTNPSIRHLASLEAVLSPTDVPSVGRPLLNLAFALNYAIGGLSVRGYHALNLLIHSLAGITMFGIVRATLSLPGFRESCGRVATLLALAVAAVWTVHPVQTESVTYISQRAESLMGLFYLLTLYFFIRSALSSASALWAALSVLACVLGMMTKEVMVSAPLIVFLYDRTFLAGSFREAWRQRWRTYLGLAATWLILAGLMVSRSLQSRGIGYGTEVTWWAYALTESKVVVDYLKLSLWPHPLVFDYGPDAIISGVAEATPYLILLFLLLSLTVVALRRWPRLGFLCAWFFVILAPTSSVVPVFAQPMAESRLYLPLAAIVTLEFVGLYTWAGRKGLLIGFPALAIFFGILTMIRNSDYGDELTLWRDTVLKCPGNSRAHDNLGNVLERIPGHLADAMAQFETSLKINPSDGEAHNNLGLVLEKMPGRLSDAIAHYNAALEIKPDYAIAHNNLGSVLATLPGRVPDAIGHFEAALKIKPDFAEAHNNLGIVFAKTPGRLPDAVVQFEAALKIKPDDVQIHENLESVLAKIAGRSPDPITHFEAVLKIDPDDASAHNNLGIALAKAPGRLPEAIAHFEAAIRIRPDYAEAHFNLGYAFQKTVGHDQEARVQFETALRLRPDWEPLIARVQSAQP